MKIVILGGTGQIGSILYTALKNSFLDAEIIATSRSDKMNGCICFDPFISDWDILGKVDFLINAIGAIIPEKDSSLEKVHIGIAEKIIENFRKIGSPKLIHISALGADKQHRTAFLRSKGIADKILLQLPNATILRPSIVYTSETMLAKKIRIILQISQYTGGIIAIPAFMQRIKIQPIKSDDLVSAILNHIKSKDHTGILELAGPEKYTMQEMLEMSSNKKLVFLPISNRLSNLIVNNIIRFVFPKIIFKEMYLLLKEDNVSTQNMTAKLLGRLPEKVNFTKN